MTKNLNKLSFFELVKLYISSIKLIFVDTQFLVKWFSMVALISGAQYYMLNYADITFDPEKVNAFFQGFAKIYEAMPDFVLNAAVVVIGFVICWFLAGLYLIFVRSVDKIVQKRLFPDGVKSGVALISNSSSIERTKQLVLGVWFTMVNLSFLLGEVSTAFTFWVLVMIATFFMWTCLFVVEFIKSDKKMTILSLVKTSYDLMLGYKFKIVLVALLWNILSISAAFLSSFAISMIANEFVSVIIMASVAVVISISRVVFANMLYYKLAEIKG